ncbi:MAG TPA: M1 family metallopeptidase [Vicinamibacterales bacterium]|nr:M1 family metallopeptidase [Vicinamibacterales bacterium]
MHWRIGALLLLFTATLNADTYPRQPGIDALHYVFRVGLTDASSEIAGETTMTVKFLRDSVVDLNLDLTSLSIASGMTVQSVRRGGPIDMPGPASDNLSFTHSANRLHIVMPPLSKAGQEFTFTIRYRGTPAAGLRIGANMHGDRTVFGENWPNLVRNWLPMIDHPYDKATGEFVITAPNQYQVVANGLLIEELDLPNNMRRTHWKQSVPIASWLYTIAVARFSSHVAGAIDGAPIQTWVFPQDRDAGIALFEDTSRRALQFFITNIGPYSYEKLANVQATGFTGGTEYASAIFYGEKGVSAGRGPVVHEIAHQWFGDSVTERDWDDVWLSEGFATYFALLFTEHDEGRDAFVDGLKRSRTQVLQLEQKLPDTPVIHRNLSDMQKVLNNLIYQKGGWVLHMLRQEVGTENFWVAIREYYRRYRNSNASTADLRAVFEQVSGKPLEWFFTQWLNRPGVPKIEGSWRYDAARKAVEVTIAQSQASAAYRVRLDVGIIAKAGDLPRVETVDMIARQGTYTFASDVAPASVILDPGTTLLLDAGPFFKR